MNRAFLFVTVAVAATAGCQNDPACTNCPDLTGSWSISYANDASTGDCSAFAVAGADGLILNISQSGSTLSSALYGLPLTGTLFRSQRFSLTGGNFQDLSTDGGDQRLRELGPAGDRHLHHRWPGNAHRDLDRRHLGLHGRQPHLQPGP